MAFGTICYLNEAALADAMAASPTGIDSEFTYDQSIIWAAGDSALNCWVLDRMPVIAELDRGFGATATQAHQPALPGLSSSLFRPTGHSMAA
jgi:hypothetical protein